MVNLTRIYTRTGDAGTTRLGDMSETGKTDSRLQAYADVDETNAHLGVVLATGEIEDDVAAVLTHVQNDLFDVGADFCTPVVENPEYPPLRIEQEYVDRLEGWCDHYNEELPKLRSFILNGGTLAAAHLHVARTVCRRAERSAWAAYAEYADSMNVLAITYLNRLSDLLFILARHANRENGDVLWVPGGERGDSLRPRALARGTNRWGWQAICGLAGEIAAAPGFPGAGETCSPYRDGRDPGGPASSHDCSPVSELGLIASSASPRGVRQTTTTWPAYSANSSAPSGVALGEDGEVVAAPGASRAGQRGEDAEPLERVLAVAAHAEHPAAAVGQPLLTDAELEGAAVPGEQSPTQDEQQPEEQDQEQDGTS